MTINIVGIVLGFFLACWGLFHQLIVGGAATMFKDISENEARLFVMSWVAQGGFMTFAGLAPAVMLLLHGPYTEGVQTICILSGIALVLLSVHVFATGFKSHLKPIRIGAVLELTYGVYLLGYVLYLSF